jgi:hypothetical protein
VSGLSVRELVERQREDRIAALEYELLNACDVVVKGSTPAGWTVTGRGKVGYSAESIGKAVRRVAEKLVAEE